MTSAHGPYTIGRLEEDVVYGSSFTIHLVLKVRVQVPKYKVSTQDLNYDRSCRNPSYYIHCGALDP